MEFFGAQMPDLCKGYEYSCIPDLDAAEHMRLVAEMILPRSAEPGTGSWRAGGFGGDPEAGMSTGPDQETVQLRLGVLHETGSQCEADCDMAGSNRVTRRYIYSYLAGGG